jgi:hypothetical protein
LAIEQYPCPWNSAAIDFIFHLKRCTPVFLVFTEEQICIIVFVISFLLHSVKELLVGFFMNDLFDLHVGS